MLVGGQVSEGLKPFREVVGHQESVDVRFELGVRAVMVALNCRLLERSVHPLNLTVPVKRFAIIGFDSIDKAKDWYASAEMKDINAYIVRTPKGESSRSRRDDNKRTPILLATR